MHSVEKLEREKAYNSEWTEAAWKSFVPDSQDVLEACAEVQLAKGFARAKFALRISATEMSAISGCQIQALN